MCGNNIYLLHMRRSSFLEYGVADDGVRFIYLSHERENYKHISH